MDTAHMNNLGMAYRNQAIEIISICRVLPLDMGADPNQDIVLSSLLQACDYALSCIARAGEKRSPELDHEVERVIKLMEDCGDMLHFPCTKEFREQMKEAMNKDREEPTTQKGWLSCFKLLPLKTKRTRTDDEELIAVKLLLPKSLTDTRPAVVKQVVTDGRDSIAEVLWNFSRFSHLLDSRKRITLNDSPQLYSYRHLPIKSPNTFKDTFTCSPTGDFVDTRHKNAVYVLTNEPGRVFLECGKNSRTFDNVWKVNGIYIFKDISGILEGEGIIGALIQGRPCEWRYMEPQPSKPDTGSAVKLLDQPSLPTDTTDIPAWLPVKDWREPVVHVLESQAKIHIRVIMGPTPS